MSLSVELIGLMLLGHLLREKKILTFIENNIGCKIGEISQKLDIPLATLKKDLPVLLAQNLIEKHGIGAGTHYSAV